MNDLSNEALAEKHCRFSFKPIPKQAIFVLVALFFIGLSVSIFILVSVRNAVFFVCFVCLSSLVVSFVLWNARSSKTRRSVTRFVRSLPESDLAQARDGQLVKITGTASCEGIFLESSYEKATRCIFTSTLLYEHGGLSLKPLNMIGSYFQWNLTYCERFCTEFSITDKKSGLRAIVKAGFGCRVIPMVVEGELVNTKGDCRFLSPPLRKWLRERNLSDEARLLRLEEGYVEEGNTVSVVGIVSRENGITTIVEPSEMISTGCLWRKLLLPVDIDGLILTVSQMADPSSKRHSFQKPSVCDP